jgi:hypothetical protein
MITETTGRKEHAMEAKDMLQLLKDALGALEDPYLGEDDGERERPLRIRLAAAIAATEPGFPTYETETAPEPWTVMCPYCLEPYPSHDTGCEWVAEHGKEN